MRRLVACCLLILFAIGSAVGQQSERQKGRRYVVAPSEVILLAVASQPDCPLQIEKAKYLLGADGGWTVSYQVRNRGTKPIRSYSVVAWNAFGAGGTVNEPNMTGRLLMPRSTVRVPRSGYQIVPLSEELRSRLQLRGSMKLIVVLVVERIIFADRSRYDRELTSKALQEYFEKVDARAPRSDLAPH
jgi:hypothetical protein